MKKYYFIFIFLCSSIFTFAQLNTERILAIGKNALYFEDYVLSIQYFSQVIKIKPYLAEPYMYRGIAKIQLGDFQGANADCSEAIDRNPFMPQAYYARGFARQRLGLFAEAATDFSKALEFNPDNETLIASRIDAWMRGEDFQRALKDMDAFIERNPKAADLYYDKGRIQMAMQDTLGAEKSFNRYIELDSNGYAGWSARALLKLQRNDDEGALLDYNEAIKRNSTYFGDYINRGIINDKKNNYMLALSDYDNAVKYDPKSALAYYNRGLLRARLGDYNNAADDLQKVLELDSANTEARYKKALVDLTIGQYKSAITDFKIILEKHPYFLPVYYGLAQAEDGLGNKKEATKYRQTAANLDANKESIRKQQKQEDIVAENKISNSSAQQIKTTRNTQFFNRYLAQNTNQNTDSEGKYSDPRRGSVQDKYTDVVNERNFILTYYVKQNELRRTPLYHIELDKYNKQHKLSAALKITNNELPLTTELVNNHFAAIDQLSKQLEENGSAAEVYFKRAIEFALVQDFNSSVEDLNKTISLKPDFMLAYFLRANIRYKQVEFSNNVPEETAAILPDATNPKPKSNKPSLDKQYKYDVEMIMRDYDKVIDLSNDFSFAYYNKANILCTLQDFRSAISNYTKAIQAEPDFAEAYFNRGLTYLFVGENEKGLADLSRAGELGIYSAYNLITRFKNSQ